jgi:hypothetical protein
MYVAVSGHARSRSGRPSCERLDAQPEMPFLATSIFADAATTTAIVVAVVAAFSSLVVAVASQVLSRRTSKDLALLASRLEQEGKERDARRDYEYEAKKRLYEECEPLLFQAVELAENARARIVSLARTSRSGDLRPDGSGWLERPGYYFKSTAFLLIAPMTSFKILQRRLTAIDLSLEPRIREQYEIIKLLFLSFARDFELARYEPTLPYDPDRADPGKPNREHLLAENPQVYARQGLYRGTLDVVVDALIHTPEPGTKDGVPRCKTYGEFLAEFDESESAIHRVRLDLDELFSGFHPHRKPVLWRLLVTQALLYDALLQPQSGSTAREADFDWLHGTAEGTKEDVAGHVRAARSYVEEHLTQIKSLTS